MEIKNAEFIISAVSPKQYPTDSLPQIALAGRSNVGKSSLINQCIHRKNLAHTGSKPGKTRTLNFYRINHDGFYFVDLPGYGFAQVSQSMKEQWGKFIEDYLKKSPTLKGVIQIIDIRHAPSKDDVAMYQWLIAQSIPILVVATKADKISKGQWLKQVKQARQVLGADAAQEMLVFSAETGQGAEALTAWVAQRVMPIAQGGESNGQ